MRSSTLEMDELFTPSEYYAFPLEAHQSMLADRVRLGRFDRALRAVIRPGDTVVDVGTGTGILAFLAHRHGAGRVVALDCTDAVRFARRVKRLNHPRAPIRFAKLDALRDPLPKVRADVIVCELIGYFGIGEELVEVVARCRDRLLKPGGRLVPSRMEFFVAPVECPAYHANLTFWSRPVAGLDFSPFQRLAYDNVYLVDGDRARLLGDPVLLAARDLATCAPARLRARRSLEIRRGGSLHGFLGFFRATLADKIVLGNDPREANTHWGQVFLPVGPALPVARGDHVDFRFRDGTTADESRWSWSGAVRPRDGRRATRTFRRVATTPP